MYTESCQQELSHRECGLVAELLPGWCEALYLGPSITKPAVVGMAKLTPGYLGMATLAPGDLPGLYFSNSHSLYLKGKKRGAKKTYMKDSNSSLPLIMDFLK